MSRLSRAINYESKALLAFKNRKAKIIIVYDNDETFSTQCATTLMQRGYENVFVLSGGLNVAKMKFPSGLTAPFDDRLDLSEANIIQLEDRLGTILSKCARSFIHAFRTVIIVP